jgi:acetyl-CoA C-acetyltransferase
MKSIKYIFTTSKISKNNVYIVAAKRTPIGSFMGKISHLNAIQLASNAIKGTLDSIQLNPN